MMPLNSNRDVGVLLFFIVFCFLNKATLKMVPGGRKHSGKSGKPSMMDQPKKAFDFEKEDKDLSGSEEDVADGKSLMLGNNNS